MGLHKTVSMTHSRFQQRCDVSNGRMNTHRVTKRWLLEGRSVFQWACSIKREQPNEGICHSVNKTHACTHMHTCGWEEENQKKKAMSTSLKRRSLQGGQVGQRGDNLSGEVSILHFIEPAWLPNEPFAAVIDLFRIHEKVAFVEVYWAEVPDPSHIAKQLVQDYPGHKMVETGTCKPTCFNFLGPRGCWCCLRVCQDVRMHAWCQEWIYNHTCTRKETMFLLSLKILHCFG